MYHTYHHHPRPRGSYFLPFLSLIILGLIVVLVFQIVDYFREKRLQALENKAAVKIAAGRAEMKIWGVDQWTSALSGSILNEGDIIKTSPGSRVVLSLLNGSVVRLSSETEVELIGLKSHDSTDEASFALKKGEIWLKSSEKETVRAVFKVTTPHLEVDSLGTIFDVEARQNEEVHVMSGSVKAAVKVPEDSDSKKMRVADAVEIALGQELSIGQSEINAMQNRKTVYLLAMLSDDFRESEWYSWNRNEDLTEGVGITVADAVQQKAGAAQPPVRVPPAPPPPAQVQEITAVLSAPVVISPKESERTTRTGTVLITGKTGPATDKLEVTTYLAGKRESYILQKYKSGSGDWSYVASREYGNLLPGENKFTVIAIGKDGVRSDPLEITLVYDKPKEPADLSAPVVLSFNKTAAAKGVFETTEDAVLVEGKIGKGIAKMWVNDFALTRYVMDSGVWTYSAKPAYGNLKEGENSYSVYGVDLDGNKTAVAKFTIIKKPKPQEAEAAASVQPAAPAESAERPAL